LFVNAQGRELNRQFAGILQQLRGEEELSDATEDEWSDEERGEERAACDDWGGWSGK
jgi:hypothetical protein